MKQNKYQSIIKTFHFSNKLTAKIVFCESFDHLLSKYGPLLFFLLISLIIFFIFKDFILFKKIYLFKDFGNDSINISYPSYYNLADYILKEGFPKWSFNQGMGQNIFPSMDPFALFIIFMGKDAVYYSIFFAELLKIYSAALFFYLFLKKIALSNYTAIIGGVLYSFSGFIILGGQWNCFSTQAVYVALLLFSFEKLYQDNNWVLFPISLFLIASNQPLDLYFIGLFLIIYIVYRLFEAHEDDPKKIFRLSIKLLFLGITGIAMSCFFLINILHIMMESPRGSGTVSYFHALFGTPIFGFERFGETHYLTAFMRFFSNDILGMGYQYRGWNSYLEAPLFYCGLILLILLPQFLKLFDQRKKNVYIFLIVIFVLPIIFPFFRYAYWLFTGNYYRIFSLFVVIVILLIALKSLDVIDSRAKADIRIITGTLLILLFFLYYPYKNSQIINKHVRDMVTIFLMIYSVLIYLIQFKKINNIVKLTILIIIVIELGCFHYPAVNKRSAIISKETNRKIGYNDYTVDAVTFIKSNDKTFFRINKDYHSGRGMVKSLNDAKVQDFYGTSSYSSFNSWNYINFLLTLEIIRKNNEYETRHAYGLAQYPLLHSFASIKYALSKDQSPHLLKFGYDFVGKSFGDVKVLKNKFVLPLGFTYEKYITLKEFEKLSQNQKIVTLYKAVVIDDSMYNHVEGLTKFSLSETPNNYYENEYAKDIDLLKQNTMNITEHGQNKIKGEINIDKERLLFFSIPFDRGWHVKIDGQIITPMKVNISFIGVPLKKGSHHIELFFTPLYFHIGSVISLIAFVLFIALITFKYLHDRHYEKGNVNILC